MSSSISKSYRDKGNIFYSKFKASLNYQDQFKYLQNALNSYYLAIDKCDKHIKDDHASALKNYAMANWKIALISIIIKKPNNLIEYYYIHAISHFSKAIFISQGIKSEVWINALNKSFQNACDDLIVFIEYYEKLAACKFLEKILSRMIEDSQQKKILFKLSKNYNELGVAAITEKKFKEAMHYLHNSNQPVELCRKFAVESKDQFYLSEATILLQDNTYNLEIAESLQAIYLGDNSLEQSLLNGEIIMDFVYDAIDWYKKAIINSRQLELEIEAWALSKLGFLYANILKMKFKGKEYFLLSLEIANHVRHKGVTGTDWYKKVLDILKKYQQNVVDDEKANKEKLKYLEELQPVINKLNQANVGSGPNGLLTYIYKNHPPKNEIYTLDLDLLTNCTLSKQKSILRNATLHYHPDKQIEFNDIKWTILCEEITKLLNSQLNKTKNLND